VCLLKVCVIGCLVILFRKLLMKILIVKCVIDLVLDVGMFEVFLIVKMLSNVLVRKVLWLIGM